MEGKKLIKKTGLYFIGNLSSKILTFVLVPIYAFYIKSEELGEFDYAQTIMNIIVPICFVAIWEAILKFVIQEDDDIKKNKIIATSSVFTITASLFIFAAAVFYNIIDNSHKTLFYFVFMIISYAFMFIWQYYARALGKNKIYVLTGIIGTAVNFTLNIFLICFLSMGLKALFISYIFGNVVIAVILETRIKILKRIKIKSVDLKVLKKMFLFSAPLVLNLISTWLITGFGRTVIKDRLGDEYNGMYAFANKFAIVISMLGSVINMAIIEEALISAKTEGIGESFKNTIENLFRIFQSMIIAAAPVIVIFYYTIKNTEYYDSIVYFPMLLMYSLIMIMTTGLGTVFQVIEKTKYQFITTVLGAITTVVLSYGFIDKFGLHSIIIAQVAGAFVMLISRYIFVNKYVEFKINWIPICIMLIIYCLVCLICINFNLFINIAVFIISVFLLAYYNRNFMKNALIMIRNKK